MENTVNVEVELEIVRDILNFVDYVYDFYNGNDGIYKINGLTVKHVTKAVYTYFNNNQLTWGGGDSVDRENVRDIILKQNSHLTIDWN